MNQNKIPAMAWLGGGWIKINALEPGPLSYLVAYAFKNI